MSISPEAKIALDGLGHSSKQKPKVESGSDGKLIIKESPNSGIKLPTAADIREAADKKTEVSESIAPGVNATFLHNVHEALGFTRGDFVTASKYAEEVLLSIWDPNFSTSVHGYKDAETAYTDIFELEDIHKYHHFLNDNYSVENDSKESVALYIDNFENKMRQRFGLREVDIADIREKFKDKNYMFRKDYNQIKDIESDIALIQEGMTSEDSWVEPNIVIGGVGFGNPNYGKMIEEVHDIKHDENYQINIDEERLVDEIYNQGSRPGNRIGMPAYDRPSKDDIREMIRNSKKDKDSPENDPYYYDKAEKDFMFNNPELFEDGERKYKWVKTSTDGPGKGRLALFYVGNHLVPKMKLDENENPIYWEGGQKVYSKQEYEDLQNDIKTRME